MTKLLLAINSRRLCFALIACALTAEGASEKIPAPAKPELTDLIGERLPGGIPRIIWQSTIPPHTNLLIYQVLPSDVTTNSLVSLADHFHINGELRPLPPYMPEAPGFWIRELNPTNGRVWSSVYLAERSGLIGYSSGEDNHRWDVQSHKPFASGVPDEKEALRRVISLLPLLSLSTNDLEHLPDGSVKYACDTEGTTYNDRYDNWKQKRYVRQINIAFWQRLQDNASVLSIGGGGMLRVGFISDGKLTEMNLLFRKLKPVGSAIPKSVEDIESLLKSGEARSFSSHIPGSLNVTNCTLKYPQGNSSQRQTYLWPVYSIDGVYVEDGDTNTIHLYVPLSW